MAPPERANPHAELGVIRRISQPPTYVLKLLQRPTNWHLIKMCLRVSPTHTQCILSMFRITKYLDNDVLDCIQANLKDDFYQTANSFYKIIKAKTKEVDKWRSFRRIAAYHNVFDTIFSMVGAYLDARMTLRLDAYVEWNSGEEQEDYVLDISDSDDDDFNQDTVGR